MRRITQGQGLDYSLAPDPTPNLGAAQAPLAIAAETSQAQEPARAEGGARPAGARERIRRTIGAVMSRVKGAAVRGTAIALCLGAMVQSAFAQTEVTKPVPLRPVAVQSAQIQKLGPLGDQLTQLRGAGDFRAHRDRAAQISPFIGTIQVPDGTLSPEVHNFVWRMIARSVASAEGAPDLTNLIPTTPVAGELMWRATIKDAKGKTVEVLPLMLPQLRKADGSLDEAAFLRLFSRMNNPNPAPGEKDVMLAANTGYQNGRAAYFPLDPLNPEPIQPHLSNGTLVLPQFTTLAHGRKTVYTVGALCVKGNGPSFQPDGSGWGSGWDYASQRKKTPLNEELRPPIYTGSTTFGLFNFEPDAKTNEYGWQLRDKGAYNGVSVAHIKLNEMVDYQLGPDGKPMGHPVAISVDQMKKDKRVADGTTPSLIWRAFETEYRLSAYKNPEQGLGVFNQVRALFARDAIFDHIANSPALDTLWQRALERGAAGDASEMQKVWKLAVDALNKDIAAGKSYLRSPVEVDAAGVATVSKVDWLNVALMRSARNTVVLNELGLVHNSIASGGDNINAAFEIVDNDDLNPGSTTKDRPRDHRNISEFTDNIEEALRDLVARVPELKPFQGKVRDLLLEAIDREMAQQKSAGQGRG